MLKRLYIHNFRCLENFEFLTRGASSILLIGKNGAGKSTISYALELFQKIGRGVNQVGQLVQQTDYAQGRTGTPMRFILECDIRNMTFTYELAFELPDRFSQLRVLSERLSVDGTPLFTRDVAQVHLLVRHDNQDQNVARFLVDWHLVALPIIQVQSAVDPLSVFKTWLAQMVILAPVAGLLNGMSRGETLEPHRDGTNFAEWFTGVLASYPQSYSTMEKLIRQVMPDFSSIVNQPAGGDSKRMIVRFEEKAGVLGLDMNMLSDGEKCYLLCAVLIAANLSYGPMLCFWDEPDNYLSLAEVGHFVMELRRAFEKQGQIIVTSHNPEAIRQFSAENTFVMTRRSHLEPVQIRMLEELETSGDLVNAIILGDLFDESE